VNNQSSSLGTFESPYPTIQQGLAAASPESIIYVYRGGGTAYDTGASGITLQDGQSLWGASTKQLLVTTLGEVSIAAHAIGLPTFTGADGNHAVIVLKNNNQVSGVHVTSTSARSAIVAGDPDNIDENLDPLYSSINPSIINNSVDGIYTNDAIKVAARGYALVSNNVLSADVRDYWGGISVYSIQNENLSSQIIGNVAYVTRKTGNIGAAGVNAIARGSSSHKTEIVSNFTQFETVQLGDAYGININSDGPTSILHAYIYTNTVVINKSTAGNALGVVIFSNGSASKAFVDVAFNQVLVSKIGAGSFVGILVNCLGDRSDVQIQIRQNTITASANLGSNRGISLVTGFGAAPTTTATVFDNIMNLMSGGVTAFGIRAAGLTGNINTQIQYNKGSIGGSASTKAVTNIVGMVTGVFEPNEIVVK